MDPLRDLNEAGGICGQARYAFSGNTAGTNSLYGALPFLLGGDVRFREETIDLRLEFGERLHILRDLMEDQGVLLAEFQIFVSLVRTHSTQPAWIDPVLPVV